ncbi:MAG: phosphatidate cytidylyltransferase [Chloroflexi bacterium]|nr:phosphatidate cytidylyltransferase [Chloroflexota bacterium]
MLLRVLTALVGVPVLLSAVWWGAPWLTLLVLLVAVLGISEIYRLLPPDIGPLPIVLGALWCASLVLGAQASSTFNNFLLISGGIWVVGAFLAILWLIAFYQGRRYLIALIYLAGGPIYVGFLLAHAVALREVVSFDEVGLDAGRNWLLFALLVTFATDTGAYFTGRSLGRRPMAPRLSPSKTWEGAAGGLLSGLLGAVILSVFLDLYLTGWKVALIGATVAVVCQWGDLFESKLKRIAGEKDSGSIIPGHGGVLDRLDSILISVPAVYYLVSPVVGP